MTKVDVGTGGYTEASSSLQDANFWAASSVADLGSALMGSGSMAGDSSIAGEFAAAYDEAARATLDAFCDVVDSTASLCRLVVCSFENHTRAEVASIRSPSLVTWEPVRAEGQLLEAPCYAVPPSLGGDASFLPDWANLILDHVEGFVWPDADVDRLRSTATAWRTASGQLADVEMRVWAAARGLQSERSPEIDVAVGVVGDLAMRISELSVVCGQLADVCDDYATQVEEHRRMILDLVEDLVREAVIIAAAGFVLGLFTGGSGNAVAAWVNAGKLAAHVPRLKGFVDALRVYAVGVSGALRTSAVSVAQVRGRLSPIANAAPIRVGGHVAVVDAGALARIRGLVGNPKLFNPDMLRGMSRREIRELLADWAMVPARTGGGTVLKDPLNRGRQFRLMNGYTQGNRASELTHGPYLVISQNGKKFKVPLKGNPLL